MKNLIRKLHFPKIEDPRGNLSFFENNTQIPFEIVRTYWIYDVPGGQHRGSHAYYSMQEVIVALSGSFDVVLHDGAQQTVYSLNRSYYGLYIPPLIWRSLENFSTNALALIVTDKPFSEKEYIRDFKTFISLKSSEVK
jgi:hypothetical protein